MRLASILDCLTADNQLRVLYLKKGIAVGLEGANERKLRGIGQRLDLSPVVPLL